MIGKSGLPISKSEKISLIAELLEKELEGSPSDYIDRRDSAFVNDIAIIGMSARFPGANNVNDLWDNIQKGVHSVTEVPSDRWDHQVYYNPDPNKPNCSNSKWGGFVNDVDKFDPLFFKVSPAEAKLMDPQHRLFLEECWHALEDSGYAGNSLANKKCGVYVGVAGNEYTQLMSGNDIYRNNIYSSDIYSGSRVHVLLGNTHSMMAARIAYMLDLKGPTVCIDTACSSSLVAIHLACKSLQEHDTDMMLAGGVSLYLTEVPFLALSEAGLFSPTGKCRSFDNAADGMVVGEGVGVVVLKLIDKAVEDGDHIYGVIKGSAINHDGKTNGITAPSVRSQSALEIEVYDKCGINPETITMVEAMGAGSKHGDSIEVEALNRSFKTYTQKNQYCAIGSVKSNIGHTSVASGVAGLIKTLLSMKNGMIPPTLHVNEDNEQIDFTQSPFYISKNLHEWKHDDNHPKRAAISSFGLTGTNCHMIVEEYIPRTTANISPESGTHLFVLSAKNKERLNTYVKNMLDFLRRSNTATTSDENDSQNGVKLDDIVYTLQVGREAMEERLAILAGNKDELIEKLSTYLNSNNNVDGIYTGSSKDNRQRTNLLEHDEDVNELIEKWISKKKYSGIAEFWVSGMDMNWELLYNGTNLNRVSLPTYPFSRDRYWIIDSDKKQYETDQTEDIAESHIAESIESIEEKLINIWSDVLGVTEIDIHDNFIDLGGHSLLAARVTARVNEIFQTELYIDSLFESPTLKDLANKIKAASKRDQMKMPPIVPVSRDQMLPLSYTQWQIWMAEIGSEGRGYLNVPVCFKVKGPIDAIILEKSLNEIIRRHEILRTTYDVVDGEPAQFISPFTPMKLPIIDLQEYSEEEKLLEAARIDEQTVNKPFDLNNDLMLRVNLVKLGDDEYELNMVLCHLAFDIVSMVIFLSELVELYNCFSKGELSTLQELPIQYADYAHIYHNWYKGDVFENEVEYWNNRLEGIQPMSLSTDRPHPPIWVGKSGNGKIHNFIIDIDNPQIITSFLQSNGVSMFMLLYSTLAIMLTRYSGEKLAYFGCANAHRNTSEIERSLGYFVTMVQLHVNWSGDLTILELINKVRESVLEAFTQEDPPIVKLIEYGIPLPNIVVEFIDFKGMGLYNISLDENITATVKPRTSTFMNFDLAFSLQPTETEIIGRIDYSVELFDEDRIDRMAKHMQVLINAIVKNPQQKISELPLITDEECNQLLEEWNKTDVTYPSDKCLHQLFEDQVERTPEAVAVSLNSNDITYGELNIRANQIAHYLQSMGVRPDTLVGICMDHSIDMIISILGILKAGGAYVPLDPGYPKKRLALICDDSNLSTIISKKELLDRLPDSVQKVCIDADYVEIASFSTENPTSSVNPDNLVYVIYTSGSTGKPKGVCDEHRSIVSMLSWAKEEYTEDQLAGVLASTPISCDSSTFELFVPLSWGHKVILTDSPLNLSNSIARSDITLINTTPSIINRLLQTEDIPASVSVINLFGESFDNPLVQKLYQLDNIQKVYNVYGHPEVSSFSIVAPMNNDTDSELIGRPIGNIKTYILDENMNIVPIGVDGELYIGGIGLSRGYINATELQQSKFVINPFINESSELMFKTGDCARYLVNGDIKYRGNLDRYVKFRGYNVDLREIEVLLTQYTDVSEAFVTVRESNQGERNIIAYIVAIQGVSPAIDNLLDYLRENLPDYMIPSAIEIIKELPLTSTFEIDQDALPLPEAWCEATEDDHVAPRDDIEEKVIRIWEEFLTKRPLGITDNFLELSGSASFGQAAIMCARITEHFGVVMNPTLISENPTAAQMAEYIKIEQKKESTA